MLSILLSTLPALAQDYVLNETLATGASADEVRGGTFTGAGWRVDDANSRLYWDFGMQLERGDLSVTIDGISWGNLLNANNHLVELFSEGGHSSDNRAINLRLYGEGDGDPYGEWGDLKFLGWDRTTNPGGEHLVAEQRYYGLDWDGLPHTWRITWDLTDFVLYRDGAELVRQDVTGIDLRVRYLWLPLQGWGGDYSAPIGTLYSNLTVQGWEPGSDEDTGVPDDGDPSTVTPVQDVSGVSWESGVYPQEDDIAVESDGGPPDAVGYLLFDLSHLSGTVTSATLHLHARSSGEAVGDGATVYRVSDTGWSEDTLTWSSRPGLGSALASTGAIAAGQEVDIDVTAGVQAGGLVAFGLAAQGSNGVHLSSKEEGDGSTAPVLIVTTRADDGGDADSDSDSDTDTDTDTDADTDADADRDASTDTASRDGNKRGRHGDIGRAECGCGATSDGGMAGVAMAGAVLAALVRRRVATRTR